MTPHSTPATPYTVPVYLKPGVWLTGLLRMPVKMGLIAVILLVPLTLSVAHLLQGFWRDIQTTQRELEGLATVERLFDVALLTQTLRSQTNLLLSGDASLAGDRQQTQARLAEAIGAAALRYQGRVNDGDEGWQALEGQLVALVRGTPAPADRTAVYQRFTDQVHALHLLILRAAEDSGLLFEAHPQSYMLVDLVTDRSVALTESLSLLRGLGAGAMIRPENAQEDPLAAATLVRQVQQQLRDATHKAEIAQRARLTELTAWPDARRQTEAFFRLATSTATDGEPARDPARFAEQGYRAIQAVAALQREATQLLRQQLEDRVQQLKVWTYTALGTSVAVLLLLVYLLRAFTVGMMLNLRSLAEVMRQAAKGDLSPRLTIQGRDELAQVSHELDHMLHTLSELVADVRSAASLVDEVGTRLVSDSQKLAERTQSQAESLQITTQHVRTVGDTVMRNSEAAYELSLMTKHLHQETEAAGNGMRGMVQQMSSLKGTSSRMGDIISTIDSIAFRTNILALNAAVEAARAGESGRGFAVVASEVRSLAQRTAAAAGEVRQLIQDSGSKIEDSVSQIGHVGETVESLITSIREVAMNIDTMAEASSNQSANLHQVVQAVGDIDSVTTENSALVESTSHRSMRLIERAELLQKAVSHIRLRQGTTDEAHALVLRAQELIQQQGLEKAIKTFHQEGTPYADRDLYLFGLDRSGIYRIHSLLPDKVGTSVEQLQGIDAPKFMADLWHRAETGGGWIEYEILNPVTRDIRHKTSYIVAVNDQLAIGCGAYQGRKA